MTFILPKLNYALDALSPYISAETLEYHYGKHHQAYVDNLNKLIVGSEWEKKSLVEIIKGASGGIFNNAAQAFNHEFYWNGLSPQGGDEPSGELLKAMVRDFGAFATFKEQFTEAATKLFGSGWVWLVKTKEGKLDIISTANQDNPMSDGHTPIMGNDVWEHAYYLQYKNVRADYLKAWWNVVNWRAVEKRFQ